MMEVDKSLPEEDCCRICRSCEGGQIVIFGSSGAERSIPDKIHECLPIKVSKKDGLPQTICGNCLRKLEDFSRFREVSRLTESKLAGLSSSESVRSDSEGSTSKLSEKEKGGSLLSLNTKEGLKKSRYAQLSEPHAEDYVLMKEETINVDNSNRTPSVISDYLIEFNNNTKVKTELEMADRDIVTAMRRRREVLPPMWDVFERIQSDQERQMAEAKPKGSKQALRTVLKGKFSVIHRRYIVAKGSFPCSLCGRCFRFNQGCAREGDEGDDVSDAESSDGVQTCQQCGEQMPSSDALRQHELAAHVEEPPPQHVCTVCGKSFNRAEHLNRHMTTHAGERPFQCNLCLKVFNRSENLARHMITHSGERPFKCHLCEKVFTRKEHLIRHRLTHSAETGEDSPSPVEEKPVICDLCTFTCSRRDQLTKHKKAVHNVEETESEEPAKPFQCNFCMKTFTRKEHLKRHKKLHLRDIPLTVNSPQVVDKQVGKDTVTFEISSGGGDMAGSHEVMSNILEHGRYGEVSIERKGSAAAFKEEHYYPAEELTDEQREQLEGFLETSFGVDPELLSSGDPPPRQSDTPTEEYYEEKDCIDLEDLKKMPKCRICAKAFPNKNHLNRHLKRYHNLSKEQVQSGKFEIYENGNKRLLGDGGEVEGDEILDEDGTPVLKRPRCIFPCSVCRKTFTRKYHMYRHQKTQHGIEFPTREQQKDEVKCPDCGLIFLSTDELNSHECVEEVDTDREPARRRPTAAVSVFKCAMCKTTFETHEAFKDHDCKKVHRCTTCGETFEKGRLLAVHMETHTAA